MAFIIGGNTFNSMMADTQDYTQIVQSGLKLHLDASALESYPGSGTIWYDMSGNDNHGTLTNGPTFNSANGGSIVFDGTNDYVINTSFRSFQTTTGTIAAWAYPTQNTSDKYAISVGNDVSTGTSRAIRVYNGYWSTVSNGSTNEDYNNIVTATLNIWQYVVFAWNGTTVNFYLNGTLYTTTRTGMNTPAGSYVVIGGPPWLSSFWQGNIASAKVYDKTLTTEQVLYNYNTQKAKFGL